MAIELAPSEQSMWAKEPRSQSPKPGDDEINAKYGRRELRIVTESNREQLPNFVEALKRPGWMKLRPPYQRRPRWDRERQSRLIESFIMNIPVPPLFVYESDLAKYEVMDGQQRITAILEFYTNIFALEGLQQWPELNGRIYDRLPSEIKKGLDRRSISYIVLLKESAATSEEEALLRQQVFERLNTGAVKLSHQEIRNSLYQGKFNTLLFTLARNATFRAAWDVPSYTETEEQTLSEELAKNRNYVVMRDLEIALRFFALRHAAHYQRGMKGFLDLYMVRARSFTDDDVKVLQSLFEKTISLGSELYGEALFKPWDPKAEEWADKPQVAFADAVMVGLSRHLDQSAILLKRRDEVFDATKQLFKNNPPGTFTGRGNTKQDVQDRIRLFDEMLGSIVRG
ncbi:MAG TPA: DUF262 domain-containing protein [Candidatus Acidoferrales bacterium]|nr:DUF262 domain-containing protein [Candidatus Acidoferrales bacterium]